MVEPKVPEGYSILGIMCMVVPILFAWLTVSFLAFLYLPARIGTWLKSLKGRKYQLVKVEKKEVIRVLKRFFNVLLHGLPKGERGFALISGIIVAVILVSILGSVVVAMWPTLLGSNTGIQALTQTDAGTTTLKGVWPIVLVIVGAGVGVGVILFCLKQFGLMK